MSVLQVCTSKQQRTSGTPATHSSAPARRPPRPGTARYCRVPARRASSPIPSQRGAPPCRCVSLPQTAAAASSTRPSPGLACRTHLCRPRRRASLPAASLGPCPSGPLWLCPGPLWLCPSHLSPPPAPPASMQPPLQPVCRTHPRRPTLFGHAPSRPRASLPPQRARRLCSRPGSARAKGGSATANHQNRQGRRAAASAASGCRVPSPRTRGH